MGSNGTINGHGHAPIIDHLPPHNLDAERGAIGSMVLDNATIAPILAIAPPSAYFRAWHQVLARAISQLHRRGGPVDPITLSAYLEERGEYRKYGGDDALEEVLEGTPHAANGLYYARIVREKARQRALIAAADDTLRDAYAGLLGTNDLLARARGRLDGIGAAGPDAADEADGIGLDATVADLRRVVAATAWAWRGWIVNSALTLLAAEPGKGKTRFCFDLHRRIFHGLPWPDGTPMNLPAGGKALWVVADNQHQEICDTAVEFGIPDEAIIINAPASDPFGGTGLESDEELADFEARIDRTRPAIIFIDTITNTADFKSHDTADAKRQYKPLQEIATRQQVPIVCVTHLNAGGKVLGRRAVEKVRVVIQMEQPDPDGQVHRRRLWVSKSKAVIPPPLGVTMGTAGNEYDTRPPTAPEPEGKPLPPRLVEAMAWLRDYLGDTSHRVSETRRAAEEAGFDAKTLYRAHDEIGVREIVFENRKFWEIDDCANGEAP